jgi:tetratricopeptide (TPR) repeat protein
MNDYYDLGTYSRPVSTSCAATQLWFDRGMTWYYAFNREESVRCFRRAAEHDPDCAMAYWGIASALGSLYNRPWDAFTDAELEQAVPEARAATEAAAAHITNAAPVERALIRALGQRFQTRAVPARAELGRWNDAYAAAMRPVHTTFADDPDVIALSAEAMMMRTPWRLWDLSTGEPAQGANTLETIAVLERAMRLTEQRGTSPHAGILHMYIHAVEMSPQPERALKACDVLRNLTTDAGHLLHMPAHIDLLCGDYYAALVTSERAILADRKYLDREGPLNSYTLTRAHDVHFKLYAAMFLGQSKPAIEAANELIAMIPEQLLRVEAPPMADWLEGFVPMKVHAQVRFGRWQDLLNEPLPRDADLYRVTTAMLHYGKGVAHAVRGEVIAAEAEQQLFLEARRRVPESRRIFTNTCVEILAIAAAMLRGEIEYRKVNCDEAFAHLRTAVALEDNLPFNEPWGWMQPVRHALGALLLEQDRVEEALLVYRADLGLDGTLSRPSQHPGNVWSLLGYVGCLRRLGHQTAADDAQARLDVVTARPMLPSRHLASAAAGDAVVTDLAPQA